MPNLIQETYAISKDMKYEALYWALGFIELKKGIFTKSYKDCDAIIDADKQLATFKNIKMKLTSHKSFVILECIDKLLSMSYKVKDIKFAKRCDLTVKNLCIDCYEWNHIEDNRYKITNSLYIRYSSRLYSGLIDREYYVHKMNKVYQYGIFENDSKKDKYELYNSTKISSPDFIIKGFTATKYIGHKKRVIIPKGIKSLASCLFWDNQEIEEVILPDTLESLSGDTFFNCSNLKKVVIPSSVKFMGNNPFAGCPKITLFNKSQHFNLIDGALYSKDYSRLLYCSISNTRAIYAIKDQTKIVGKHAFYKCDHLKEVIIPPSVIKLENNPFSGCSHLKLTNHSKYYHIMNNVIYDKEKKSVIGCLSSIKADELKLLDVKRICRNSFWNCKGIKRIVLPKTLTTIGYNPFVGCSNIEFKSNSKNYVVKNGVLYDKDQTTLVCYPSKLAIGEVSLPDTVIKLERGAFSGCDKMTGINLHNVSIISKTCFTNCNSLKEVYCSDLVSYIGEWAFAHCKKLKTVSVYKDCYLDINLTKNSPTYINIRKNRTNYLIESENLYTLKSLQNGYKGKIKSIVIDPPYNSNIDYIGYKDQDFGSYANFIKERLLLSKELLSNDGFIVINIDEGEVKEIAKLVKNIFGNSFIYKWEKLHPYFDKNRDVRPGKKIVKYEYIIITKKSGVTSFNKIHQPYIKDNKVYEKIGEVPTVFSCFGTTSSAKDEIKALFGKRDYFSTPKPVKLMKELIRATTNKDSIIMDYFAGSGTVGHAVDELNKEDKGKRTFLLVSNKESNICKKVTKARLDKIKSHYTFLI